MTAEELRDLYQRSSERSHELEMIARAGFPLTRQERNELSRCVRRLGVIAMELWVLAGRPEGSEFDCLTRQEVH
jgi:hypothetical protein